MIPPPQPAESGVRINPEVEDDRTRLSHGPPSGARRLSGLSQATVPDLGDMLLHGRVVRPPALEPIREVRVSTIVRSGWGWRAMAIGAALALVVAVGTALPIFVLEGAQQRAASLRAWPMWAPAIPGLALLGALGAIVIARTALRGESSRGPR
jgi:hypothetical protein